MPFLISVALWAFVIGTFVFAQQHRGFLGIPIEYLSFGVILCGVVGQIGIVTFYDRKRRRLLAENLRTRGFVLNEDEGQPARPLHYTPGKGQHSFKAMFSGLGVIGDRPAHIAEYRYVIGHGKGAQHFRMTEFSIDFDPGAPRFTIVRRRGLFAPATNLRTGSEALNKAWRALVGENQATNEYLSNPRLAELLAVPDKLHEQWAVGDGWLSFTIRQAVKAKDLDQGFALAKRFADACGG